SEAGVRVRAQLYAPKNRPAAAPMLIWVKRASDSFYGSDVDEVLPLFGRAVTGAPFPSARSLKFRSRPAITPLHPIPRLPSDSNSRPRPLAVCGFHPLAIREVRDQRQSSRCGLWSLF